MKYRTHQLSKNYWDMEELLEELLDINYYGSDIICPFHEDSNPSASYFEEDNHLYCFRCKEIFSPADLLVEFGGYTPEDIKEELPEDLEPKEQGKPLTERDYKFFEMFEEVWYDNTEQALKGLISYLGGRK